jgi:anthranilate synthase/aminodeoxychorismate synthase-like glutamine amidotransferase
MLLLIDNYDSFVHNLARYCEELGVATCVVRNDAITVSEVRNLSPQAIILSPGPCTPVEAGITISVIQQLGAEIPTLGVCLGHQAIGAALGGSVIRAPRPVHGWTSRITHDAAGLFQNCSQPLEVARYHSLIVEESTLPCELRVTARCEAGLVMALEHRDWPLYGVQFHPESILTQAGHQLLWNFLTLAGWRNLGDPPQGDRPASTSPPDFFALPIEPTCVPPQFPWYPGASPSPS